MNEKKIRVFFPIPQSMPFTINVNPDKGVLSELLEIQKTYNKTQSDMMDAVRYGIQPLSAPKPPSIWVKLYRKLTWPLGLKLVHEDDICDCEGF